MNHKVEIHFRFFQTMNKIRIMTLRNNRVGLSIGSKGSVARVLRVRGGFQVKEVASKNLQTKIRLKLFSWWGK